MLGNNIKSIHIEYKNEGSLALNKVDFKERLTIRKDRISYKRKYYSIGNNYRWKVNISNMDEYISRIIEAIYVEMINKGEELEEYDRVFYISYTYYDEDKKMLTNSPIYKLYDVDESISLMVFELLAVSLPEVINIPLIFYSKYKVEEC